MSDSYHNHTAEALSSREGSGRRMPAGKVPGLSKASVLGIDNSESRAKIDEPGRSGLPCAFITARRRSAKNLKEFVDWAKAQNRKITCAVSTRGASTDITMQAFMKAAGINGETIPFRGGAESLTQILGGHTDFAGQVPSEVPSHVKSGRLKILGVCLRERDPFIPDVPTFMEQGVNAWTMGAIRGVAVPKGAPDSVITTLESTFKKLAEDPEFVKTMKNISHPVVYRDRQTLFKNVSDGYDMYGKLIDQLGLRQP